ncbi:MAG: asparagine synthase-related protein [Methylobacter sp.]|uniref:asparagine synthase-related protein n=1 Tax=Methylobacter sp. TaxID=2051955 RepID=UPI00272F73EB|nr:asparagine synthase-related protein [Methylobacter sp.]MDP1663590.1 asparagine synthase-related protein [Methylobacter sp.]
MRLICGFYHLNGRAAEKSRLDLMVQSMIEPGLTPQIAHIIEDSLALAILDFASPKAIEIVKSENGLLLAADCRLDEPDKLAAALNVSAQQDDLLLHALQQWGTEGLNKILGDFAFAAWNPQTRSLLCARDAMGIRPLFTTQKENVDFAFASLPRALHAGGFALRQLDESYLADELLGTFARPERSLFRDISRLPPAHFLQVSAQSIRSEAYWKLDFSNAGKSRHTPETAASALAETFTEAVRCRLPIAGSVAAHLSGGLDSSAITILAARLLREKKQPLLAYSFLSTLQDEEDERPFVEAVLKQETDLIWKPITLTDFNALLMPNMDCDQLFPHDLTEPDIRVCADAARNGASMLLSGWGGDEGATFNGRGALAEALLNGRWYYLLKEYQALTKTRHWSFLHITQGELLNYLLSDDLKFWLRRFFRKNHQSITNVVPELLRPEFMQKSFGLGIGIGSNATLNRFELLNSPHLSRRAERWALMAARYGLAVSFPMLDRRVIELSLSLPSHLFLRGGFKRRVFRDAMAHVLPEEIRWRHNKLTPFPEVPGLPAQQRQSILAWLDELHHHPNISNLFDLKAIEKLLRSDHTASESLALLRIFRAARYIQQHY